MPRSLSTHVTLLKERHGVILIVEINGETVDGGRSHGTRAKSDQIKAVIHEWYSQGNASP